MANVEGIELDDPVKPDMWQARRTAIMAHNVIAKLKEMGLPNEFDEELAALSTDLGDIWGSQKTLAGQLKRLMKPSDDWETVGDYMVDLMTTIDHIGWHTKNVRQPIKKIARFAYKKASESERRP